MECGNTVYPPSYDGARQWGGYPNGLIPPSAMCPLGVAGHVLRCDAAAAYRAMSAAFATAFGSPICITDSYRTYASQVRLYGQKPTLAAVPGTSNHGWGLAVDLCGGIEHYGTAPYTWMKANAGRFGFLHPDWAEPGQRARGAVALGVRGHLSAAPGPGIVGGRSYRADNSRRSESMLIDCDTCTARGTGCADCVVTVLLGAPPGWQSVDPVVVPMTGRARTAVPDGHAHAHPDAAAEDVVVPAAGCRRGVRRRRAPGRPGPGRRRPRATAAAPRRLRRRARRGPSDRLTGGGRTGPVQVTFRSRRSADQRRRATRCDVRSHPSHRPRICHSSITVVGSSRSTEWSSPVEGWPRPGTAESFEGSLHDARERTGDPPQSWGEFSCRAGSPVRRG